MVDLHDLRARADRHPSIAAFLLFALLSVVHTWPLASAPGYWSRNDSGDALLNTWAVAWVGHALETRPTHLYDANIFYPERRTLAYSEHLLAQGIMVAPVVWLGGSAVLAFNLALMAGFALTGWAFCLLALRWTNSWTAALVAGSAAAFNAHTLMRLPHLQTLHLEFFALALYGLDDVLGRQRIRGSVLLGVGHALQGFAGIYLFVFTSCALGFAALARAGEWARPRRFRTLLLLAAAVAIAALAFSPALLEYARLNREHGFVRFIDEARQYAATWRSYLLTGAWVHWGTWSRAVGGPGTPGFPGVTVILLCGAAVASGLAWRDARARMTLAFAVGCAYLSVAPRLPGFETVYAALPILRAVRVIGHFTQLVIVGLAVLAGFGVVALERRWGGSPRWPLVAAGLVLLVNLEALRAPIRYEPFTGIPPIYQFLAHEPRAVVVELPLYPRAAIFGNATYMLDSTAHWHPILNGYSGFIPPSYDRALAALRTFPDEDSLAFLRGLGVTHVVVHGAGRRAQIDATPALEPYAISDRIRIYRLRAH